MRAARGALDDAMTLIHTDPEQAAADYLALSKEKLDVPGVASIIRELNG
jgi:hypothetical protein